MRKLLFIGIMLMPLIAFEQVNIKFMNDNTCKVVRQQSKLDINKCDSIVVYHNYIYCILKN